MTIPKKKITEHGGVITVAGGVLPLLSSTSPISVAKKIPFAHWNLRTIQTHTPDGNTRIQSVTAVNGPNLAGVATGGEPILQKLNGISYAQVTSPDSAGETGFAHAGTSGTRFWEKLWNGHKFAFWFLHRRIPNMVRNGTIFSTTNNFTGLGCILRSHTNGALQCRVHNGTTHAVLLTSPALATTGVWYRYGFAFTGVQYEIYLDGKTIATALPGAEHGDGASDADACWLNDRGSPAGGNGSEGDHAAAVCWVDDLPSPAEADVFLLQNYVDLFL